MNSILAEWIERHALPCLYKQALGIDCPFCGFQRSLVALLRGDIVQSILLYPALIPLTFSIATLLLSRKVRQNIHYVKAIILINASIMLATTLLRLFLILP